MRLLLRVLVLLAVLGAAWFIPIGGGPAPTHVVVSGDTLSGIASNQGVTVAQLREWNHLTGDRIDVGQDLRVGEGGAGETVGSLVLAALRPQPRVEPATEPGTEAAPVVSAPPRAPRAPASQPESEPGLTFAPLVMPPAKPCLADTAVAGEGMTRSVGLEPQQVKQGVMGFQKETLRCFEGREAAVGTVLLSLVVGCDGRVVSSTVADDTTGEAGFASCVAEVFRYAAFPAHARDTVEFEVPLTYRPDGG